jgi:hypothetical protein
LTNQEWLDLQGFFHGDPACVQTLIARSDEELVYALRAAREEMLDGAHGLSRHGPDVTDAKLERRVTQGYAPDEKVSPASPSTKFKSYKDYFETREAALQQIQIGKGDSGIPVDFSVGPGAKKNAPTIHKYEITIEHSSRANLAQGYAGQGPSIKQSIPKLDGSGSRTGNVYSSTNQVGKGINRTFTAIEWSPATTTSPGRWKVVQHIPWARDFDFGINTYTRVANVIL